ncbi:MAG: hypothetical protein RL095_2038 [Verrucomicrobiota bacterium]|jgi:ABC-type Mn2+/Zn2+ transport system permease subunit
MTEILRAFIDTWGLFQDTYLSAWLLAAGLALLGVGLVARAQIFIGVACTQAATFGVAAAGALGLAGGACLDCDQLRWMPMLLASLAALPCCLWAFCSDSGRRHPEGVTGWIYLVGAAGTALCLSRSPEASNQIAAVLASTVLGSSHGEMLCQGLLVAFLFVFSFEWRHSLCLVLADRPQALAQGLPVHRLEFAFAFFAGLVLGVSLVSAGVLYTFGCLILPALAARRFSRDFAPRFWLAPLLALAAVLPAFVLGNHWDLPQAHLSVLFLAGLVPAAAIWRKLRP